MGEHPLEVVCNMVVWFTLLGVLVVWIALSWTSRRRSPPHPPGPKGYPLVGYLKAIPGPIWRTYAEWSKQYGSDVIRYNALGSNIIVVNTLKAASELLDKRSSIYSDRPAAGLTMIRDLVGFHWSAVIAPYHSRLWRDSRRVFQHTLSSQASREYRPLQLAATHRFLRHLIESPKKFRSHTRYMVGEVIIRATYGIEVQEKDDPYIAAAEHGLWIANQCLVPGRWLVDVIPLLRYVPEWLPGAGFKRQARLWRKDVEALAEVPFVQAKGRVDLPLDCLAKVVMDKFSPSANDAENAQVDDEIVKSILATIYGAGSDTTTTALDTFFLAMALNPDIQKEAQTAVDRVCRDRLPDFSDYDDLPHVHAIVRECLRWRPALPLAIPHMVTQDDQYEGYFIPAQSTVLPNIKAMLLDPDTYQDPEQFKPTRFLKQVPNQPNLVLDSDVPDPSAVVFGFGRRACPGRWIAYDSLWIAVASTLATLDIAPALGEDGAHQMPNVQYTDGLISYPEKFDCRITPRSPRHANLVDAASKLVATSYD